MRAALVHDWLTGMRGGEKCLERLCRYFPGAPLYALFHRIGSVSPLIESRPIKTSLLQRLPGWPRYYRYLLPLFPQAARWTLAPCDVVISLSHCVAKAAIPPAGVPHICYCFTPMRYAWHMKNQYFAVADTGAFKRMVQWPRERLLGALREWDRQTSDRVTHFVAISETVRKRIFECYGRSSNVIYPPVDTEFYCPADVRREDYYLIVSAFSPYKRIDLAIAACQRLRKKLIVIGTGHQNRHVRRMAGPNVQILGWQPDLVIREHMRRCRALLFPGEEDFGIVPVEAQACGTPVIAFGRGGATETVTPDAGVLFLEQTMDGLADAMNAFERIADQFDAHTIRRGAERFCIDRFDAEILGYISSVVSQPQVARQAA